MTTELTTLQPNAFESYANAMSTSRIVGDLLKFTKGDYYAGQQAREIPIGTKFAAIMDQLATGWNKWRDSIPVEQIMGLVANGYTPPRRSELGDADQDQWETDDEGRPRDPWQFVNYLILADPDTKGLYTFTTSTRGGLGAVGELCKVYGKEMRARPNEYPLVELGVGSYQHRDKAYGRIKFPVFKVVGWVDKAPFVKALNGGAEASEPEAVQQER